VTALLKLDGVDGVRGHGLMLGVELADGIDARVAYADLLEAGLIVNAVNPTTIRLIPPLNISDAEVAEAVAMIGSALDEQIAAGS
jgi:acetylornithine/succinyldiaminopimelate/putrescine aminotransferase